MQREVLDTVYKTRGKSPFKIEENSHRLWMRENSNKRQKKMRQTRRQASSYTVVSSVCNWRKQSCEN